MTASGNVSINFSKIKFVESQQNALELIEQYEIQTSTKYSVYKGKSLKNFGQTDWRSSQSRIFWEENYDTKFDQLEFDGIPYMSFGKVVLDCHHGKERKVSKKPLVKIEKDCDNEVGIERKRRKLTESLKVGCNAQIRLREIVKFPEYQIDEEQDTEPNSKYERRKISKDLRKAVLEGQNVVAERRIYIHFPKKEDHNHNLIDNEKPGYHLRVDQRLISQIYSKVAEGMTKPHDVKKHLDLYVKNYLFNSDAHVVPSPTNRRFYPTIMDIKNHIALAKSKLHYSVVDEENVYHLLTSWQETSPRDRFFFRSQSENVNTTKDLLDSTDNKENSCDIKTNIRIAVDPPQQGLLFVHQSEWQSNLLDKYGNELFLVEATYRATQYTMYFVVVCTNVDYQVVGTFVVQNETPEAIVEALRVLLDWNPQWNPSHAMTDNQKEIITALEIIFPECLALFCDYHREQSWLQRMRISSEGMSSRKATILSHLRSIAEADSETEYNSRVALLRNSREWRYEYSAKFKNWIEESWLKEHQRWVYAYRKGNLLSFMYSNHGLQEQNRTFRQSFTKQVSTDSLSKMMKSLVENYLPDLYQESYIKRNYSFSSHCRAYPEEVPEYLRDRPGYFVQHCCERLSMARQHIIEQDIQEHDGFFMVRNQMLPQLWHKVFFGSEEGAWPSCTCDDWLRFGIPCEHFFVVLLSNCGIRWENFPVWYREATFFTLDRAVIARVLDNELRVGSKDFRLPREDKLSLQVNSMQSDMSTCHSLLQQIRSKLFLIVDGAAVKDAATTLQCLADKLDESLVKNHGIDLYPLEKGKSLDKVKLQIFTGMSKPRIAHSLSREDGRQKLTECVTNASLTENRNFSQLCLGDVEEKVIIVDAAKL